MRFKTWPVAALGLLGLLILIMVSMLTLSRRAQAIFTELDRLNMHHADVDAKLRRLRSDVNLSGIFVRDYLLDVSREHAPEYRERIASFRQANITTVDDLRSLDPTHAERIQRLESQLEDYWETFEPIFDWTATEKIFRSAAFLKKEVVPRREAILGIAQEIEELNNANLTAQRGEVTQREATFSSDLRRLMVQTLLLGVLVALISVARLRLLERRSDEQRAVAEEAERQMRQLSQRLVATQEEERRNLSRELHDHVAQVLTALRMELGRIERTTFNRDARIAGPVSECRRLVDQLFRTVRDLALGLRPSMLDDLGLLPALEWLVRDVNQRYGVDVQLHAHGHLDSIPDRHRTCIYRSIQEALTNCVRHAHAQSIRVSITGAPTALTIEVHDDGVGLDPARRRSGLGLRGIEERVKELAGTMTIGGRPGQGTTLAIRLPAPPDEVTLARAAG